MAPTTLSCLLLLCLPQQGLPLTLHTPALPIGVAAPITYKDGSPGDHGDAVRTALTLAIDHLNEDYSDLNFTGLPICDTQHLILRGYQCAEEMHALSPVGIVGSFMSSVTLHMVVISTQRHLLHCSPLSTSPDLSAQVYPYFFRVIASDDATAVGMVALMKHFAWWRAVVLHTTDRFSAGLAEKLSRSALIEENSLQFQLFSLGEPNIQLELSAGAVGHLVRDTAYFIRTIRVRVVIAIVVIVDLKLLLNMSGEHGFLAPDYFWLGTDPMSSLAYQSTQRMIQAGELPAMDRSNFVQVVSRTEMTSRTARLKASGLERFNDTTSVDSVFAHLVYDCVLAIGLATVDLLRNSQLTPADLVNHRSEETTLQLRNLAFNLDFEGASGRVQFAKPDTPTAGDRSPVFSINQLNVSGDGTAAWIEKGVFRMAGNSSINFSQPIVFAGGSRLEDTSAGCKEGTEFSATLSFAESRDICLPCPLGKYKRQPSSKPCEACQPGFACNETNGTSQPKACEAGEFSNEAATQCSSCGRGHYSSAPGSSQCSECPSGRFENKTGQTECKACPTGSFQSEVRKFECQQCPDTQSTSGVGQKSRSSCGCPVGFRWALDLGLCIKCKTGLLCSVFDGPPLVQPGYYLQEDTPRNLQHIDLYRCNVKSWCLGEQKVLDPMCKEAREGLNCGMCAKGFYESGQSCLPCTAGHTLLYILGTLVMFLLCGLLQYVWNRRADELEVSEGLLFSLTAGTTVAVVQRLGVIGRIEVAWPQIVKDILSFCTGLVSNFFILTPSCALPPSLFTMYLARLCTPLLFVLCCALWWWLSRILHHYASQRLPAFSVFQVVNTTGLFLSALYIYAAMGTLSLVDCYGNPNGKRTIREFSFALCSGPEFESALPLFALGVLVYIVGLVGVTLYALWIAPTRYRTQSGFRVMIRFLVYKFRPDKYWFGLVMMCSSFLMALVTVVFPDSPFMQLLSIKAIAGSQLFVHCVHMPYTQSFANIVENAEYLGLMILLSLGTYFQDPLDDEEEKNVSLAILVLFVLMVGLVLCAFGWGLHLALCPQRAAARQRAELDDQVNCIIAGCTEILDRPENFRKLLGQATSYVERERAARLMRFFNTALAPQSDPVRSTRRLFLSLRQSGSVRVSGREDNVSPTGGNLPIRQDSAEDSPHMFPQLGSFLGSSNIVKMTL